MYSALSAGAIGCSFSTLDEGLALAAAGGFEGLEIPGAMLADAVDAEGVGAVRDRFTRTGIRPAGFGLPTDFRKADFRAEDETGELRRIAKAAKSIGCTRTFTWIMSGDNDMNVDQFSDHHISRLGPLAEVLREEGIDFGLEFVGPKTVRDGFRYPGIYTMKGMLRLAAAVGPGTGLLLDIFHLFTSGGTLHELSGVSRARIVYVHVNDARAGRTMDEQIDGERDLPGATGVLDLSGFLSTLHDLGYDGPVVAEPFLSRLKELPDDEARAKEVGASLTKALSPA